ncbi:unnamed protein product [Lymnaea stagnalis]|uniref:Peptidase C1A papain C-terminal domain-containing protein n=1 Tax=Lymnaea stagnalis TaxID=6523 RepID=A0AAV2IH59_LYMST
MACLRSLIISVLVFECLNCAVIKHVEENEGKAGDNFDWRDYGVITPVSDQGQLGSVMDFVIAEGVESLLAIKNNTRAIPLSVAEVAECCDDDFHQPKYRGFDCIVAIGGLCTPSGYKNGTGYCNSALCTPVGKVSGTGYIPTGQENFMLKVIRLTPISAYINAGVPSFQSYVSGVYEDASCYPTTLDHAVQVVGYGTDAGKDFWIIKNSWGANWGEQGYMRMLRGKNMCGIAEMAFYPYLR